MGNLNVQQLKSVSRKFWNSVALLRQHTNMVSHINDGYHVRHALYTTLLNVVLYLKLPC